MRLATLAYLAAAILCGAVAPASAGAKLVVRTQTYAITGTTGKALLQAMDRKGPKHGFMARAIAQTGYTVHWNFKVSQAAGACRLNEAAATLDLTYTYPKPGSDLTPALQKRWKRFFAGVQRHEQTHGRLAREMVRAAQKSVSGLKVADDRRCGITRREARRRIDAVYAEYEARQVAFDKREHRDGGKVDGLVAALAGKR